MGTSYFLTTSKLSDVIVVSCECENCSRFYSYEHIGAEGVGEVTSSKRRRPGPEEKKEALLKAQSELEKSRQRVKQRLLKNKLLGVKPCPHCGYIQSWAHREAADRTKLGCILSIILLWPLLGLWGRIMATIASKFPMANDTLIYIIFPAALFSDVIIFLLHDFRPS